MKNQIRHNSDMLYLAISVQKLSTVLAMAADLTEAPTNAIDLADENQATVRPGHKGSGQ